MCRFERGVDPESAWYGAHVATKMILELCGGEASTLTVAGDMPPWQREVTLRTARVAALGGLDVPADEQVRILDDLRAAATGAGMSSLITTPARCGATCTNGLSMLRAWP